MWLQVTEATGVDLSTSPDVEGNLPHGLVGVGRWVVTPRAGVSLHIGGGQELQGPRGRAPGFLFDSILMLKRLTSLLIARQEEDRQLSHLQPSWHILPPMDTQPSILGSDSGAAVLLDALRVGCSRLRAACPRGYTPARPAPPMSRGSCVDPLVE